MERREGGREGLGWLSLLSMLEALALFPSTTKTRLVNLLFECFLV